MSLSIFRVVELCDVYWFMCVCFICYAWWYSFLFYISHVFIRECLAIIRLWISILRVHEFIHCTGVCDDMPLLFFIHSLTL
jgi:hypothetical protein